MSLFIAYNRDEAIIRITSILIVVITFMIVFRFNTIDQNHYKLVYDVGEYSLLIYKDVRGSTLYLARSYWFLDHRIGIIGRFSDLDFERLLFTEVDGKLRIFHTQLSINSTVHTKFNRDHGISFNQVEESELHQLREDMEIYPRESFIPGKIQSWVCYVIEKI